MEMKEIKYKNKCCVPGCNNQASKRHRFHKDPDLCQRWIENIKPARLQCLTAAEIYRRCYVCNIHFAREFIVEGTLRGLRKDAVPTLHLGGEY
jgi:hypothetical protein